MSSMPSTSTETNKNKAVPSRLCHVFSNKTYKQNVCTLTYDAF